MRTQAATIGPVLGMAIKGALKDAEDMRKDGSVQLWLATYHSGLVKRCRGVPEAQLIAEVTLH